MAKVFYIHGQEYLDALSDSVGHFLPRLRNRSVHTPNVTHPVLPRVPFSKVDQGRNTPSYTQLCFFVSFLAEPLGSRKSLSFDGYTCDP
jgi:hypothetical protein